MKDKTLNYYSENSKEYFDATFFIDMIHSYKEFLDNIKLVVRYLILAIDNAK